MLLQTLSGIYTLLVGGVVLLFFWLARIEPKPNLSSFPTWRFLIDSTLFACSYFVLYASALRLTSPFYVSFGSLVSIPVSAVADHLIWKTHYPVVTLVGMSFILLSVLMLNLQDLLGATSKCLH